MKETPRRRVDPEKRAVHNVACRVLLYLLHNGSVLASAARARFTSGKWDRPEAYGIYARAHVRLLEANLIVIGSRQVTNFHRQTKRLTMALTYNGWVVAAAFEESGCHSSPIISTIVEF